MCSSDLDLLALAPGLEALVLCKATAVRIALGDQVIDASVRGKLAAMAVSLKN